MTCEEARGLLLEAELEELAGRGDGPLPLHLRSCASCAAAAAQILRAMDALDAHLAGPQGDVAVDAVLARLADVEAGRRRGAWRRPAWTSLALAAGAAGLFFLTRGPTPQAPDAPRIAAAAQLPLVDGSDAATVAVIETDNPDITVLWFF